MSNNRLSDPDFLFSVLTAIVKKSGGEMVITEEELSNISKGDFLGMYYEPKTGNLILKEVGPEDMLQATTMARESKDETYDN
tara:strand:- start:883 stop:1128 length:246 start_codon:yes stop_codon:yes gene_type:complete